MTFYCHDCGTELSDKDDKGFYISVVECPKCNHMNFTGMIENKKGD
uniref:Uncharacterized protein n=1 Tax=viral metagenome TaxID=1070528 RepID=A0A6M3JGG2_9ZZZZ